MKNFMHNETLSGQKKKLERLLAVCQLGQLKKKWLGTSFTFLLIATALEGFSFGLLVPFLKQASNQGRYEGWRNIPVVNDILTHIGFYEWSARIEWLLIVIVVVVCLRQVVLYASQVLFQAVIYSFEAALRATGFARMLTFGCGYFDRVKQSEAHNVLMRFTQEIPYLLTDVFFFTQSVFFTMVYAIVLLNVSVHLCILSIVLMPLFYFMLKGLLSRIQFLYKQILRHEQAGHGDSHDAFANLKLVKAFNREAWEAERFQQNEKARAKDSLMAHALYYLMAPTQEVFATLGLAAIIWISYSFLFQNDPSFLIKLIVSLLLFKRSLSAINSALSHWAQIMRRANYFRELEELLELSADKQIAYGGARLLNAIKSGIEFRGVSMGYEPSRLILEDVSFCIPKGSFTAIVGATGAGKSTIAELLLRFYDYQSGDILIDGISLKEYDISSLRRAIGYVPQETLVLNDTIYNNIKYAKPDAADSEILEAVQKANVGEFVQRQSEGLNTIGGDKGVKLSGGELQRLSLARMFLRDPEIIILDEATSALDSISENLIQDSLKSFCDGRRIVIAIAHRLSTIQNASQVIVIADGRVVESGVYQDLLERRGAFFKLWDAQKTQTEI